jgi:hypothetical protein
MILETAYETKNYPFQHFDRHPRRRAHLHEHPDVQRRPGMKPGAWTLLLFLCLDAFIVGLLARWFRPYHGLGAAIASGVVAALMLLYLWLVSPNADMSLAVGPLGMVAVIVFSTLGGWFFPRLKKQKP